MKKVGSMIYPQNKKSKIKKCNCEKCGKDLTPAEAYYYVDSCNFAITQNAKPYCRACYKIVFGR